MHGRNRSRGHDARRNCLAFSVLLALLMTGCKTNSRAMPAAPSPVTADVAPATRPQVRSIILSHSVQGRPIEMKCFGAPAGVPVLILAAIHGDETTTAELAAR